ncbi:MAG: adenylate kinase [Clostridia bacterium]|nr:adenylate kinase [Clostridia bacterium]
MNLIFLGAPGAGKGTQAEIVSERFGIPAISTGAIIREAIKTKTPMGIAAREYTDVGALVPDDIVIGIIKERLQQDDCNNGFILDGFPRTVPQAEALEKMGVIIDIVVSIEVADEDIVKRMSGRRVCDSCGASYHVVYKPSKDGENCEKCGNKLSVRRDDMPEVVLSRLATYHEQTEPLKDFYASRGVLKIVQGQEELADTTRLTAEAIGNPEA